MGTEEQRRIFEPFHSRHARWARASGLAIVYRIVRDHHGDITVRSVPSRARKSQVRLPLVGVPVSA